MDLFYVIIFFILGTVMGSFLYVVATRLSQDKSIISPPSHCDVCNHKLAWYELIPILSYIFLGGKCSKCHTKLPISYVLVELISGILYSVCYHVFGLNLDLVVALIFTSTIITIIVSDIEYMIILDEVLIFCIGAIIIINLFRIGVVETAYSILAGIGAFLTMYLLKLLGDKIFKKESLGGGDIKLLFLFGLVLGYPMSICSIFLATFIAFPIAIYFVIRKKDNIIPFGPFLSMSALILFILGIKFIDIINFIINF